MDIFRRLFRCIRTLWVVQWVVKSDTGETVSFIRQHGRLYHKDVVMYQDGSWENESN